MKEGLRLTPDGDTRRVLHIGSDGWPMPIPLVQDDATWRFDTAEGIEEINDRRVGAHELAAIELCEAYVDAQMEYASEDRDGDEVLEYAQTILSPTGTKNGLYWPTAQGEEPSPLGEFVAKADAYRAHSRLGEPYRGYFFRVLTKQGPTPPGGAYDYVINGNMIAGFALLAWPGRSRQLGRDELPREPAGQGLPEGSRPRDRRSAPPRSPPTTRARAGRWSRTRRATSLS